MKRLGEYARQIGDNLKHNFKQSNRGNKMSNPKKVHKSEYHSWNEKVNGWIKEVEEFVEDKEHEVVKDFHKVKDWFLNELKIHDDKDSSNDG